MKEEFINAIREKNKVRLRFFSKDDGGIIARICAPMDYGPSRRAKMKNDRFHLWDYDSDQVNHVLSLNPDQVVGLETLEEKFDPSDFVTWDVQKSPWFVSRDWGEFS